MKLLFCKCSFIILTCLIFNAAWSNTPTIWRRLAPGLEYTKLTAFADSPQGYIHAFKIDLKYYHLKLSVVPQSNNFPQQNFHKLMAANQAVIAINGGFFTPDLKPLGLRVTDKNQLNPTRNISWWSVFFIKDDLAYVVSPQNYSPDSQIEFAIQAGPHLIFKGEKVSGLNTKIDARTALGITANNEIVLLTTEKAFLSTIDLAELLLRPPQEGGLDCIEAVNLDGGHSAQMYATFPNFSLSVTNSSNVADAILVIPKENAL